MKKIFIIILALMLPSMAIAADGVVETVQDTKGAIIVTLAWTAAAAGTKADWAVGTTETGLIAKLITGYYLYQAVTDPGSTAPADGYDITILDADSRDLMGGALEDRDTSVTEKAVPVSVAESIRGDLTVTWADVTNANCTGTLYLFFARY